MTYTIKQGSHYTSGLHLLGFSKASPASRTYRITFSPSAWYEPSLDPERDWSKVVGWSIGILPKKLPGKPWYKTSSWIPAHHWNSIRLVNRPSGTKSDPIMELALYCYHEGIREIYPLNTTYQLGEDIEVDMAVRLDIPSVRTCYTGNTSRSGTIAPFKFTSQGWGYTLKPYAGGTYPAWNTYTITIIPQ